MISPNIFRNRTIIQLVSADIWADIRLLNQQNIPIYQIIHENDLTVCIVIDSHCLNKIKALLEKRGDRITVKSINGFQVFYMSLRRRSVLLLGFLFIFCFFSLLPSRIFVIEVADNNSIPSRKILDAAYSSGIFPGVSRRNIRSEKAKNALLSSMSEIQWAGINTYGCKAVISVLEKSKPNPYSEDSQLISSIIAAQDGVIRSAAVESGTLLCQEGQAVKEGQLLISGYTDCGLSIQAARAVGEISAETVHRQQLQMPESQICRGSQIKERTALSLILGKKRINLWKGSGIWDSSCGRISMDYYFTLPGGFRLPVALSWDRLTYYEDSEEPISQASAENQLCIYATKYLSSHMIAGIITSMQHHFYCSDNLFILSGTYCCTEMIGREHFETGAPYEQINRTDR